MAESSVGSLEATFSVNLTPLQRGLRQASSMLQAWANKHDDDTEAEVDVDISPLQAGLRDASRALERFDGSTATAKIEIDTSEFSSQLRNAGRELSRFDGRKAEASVTADTSSATRSFNDLRRQLADLSRQSGSLTVDADVRPARTQIQNLVRWASGQSASISVGADTSDARGSVNSLVRQIAAKRANISVGAATSEASRSADALRRRIQAMQAAMRVTANTDPAENGIRALRASTRDMAAQIRIEPRIEDAREKVEQFLSWIRQQSADVQIGAITTSAQRSAEIAKAYIDNLSANIDVGANTAGAVAEGRLAAGRINQMSPEFDVGAQTGGAIGEVQGVVARTNAMRGNVNVGANTQPAESELAGFNQTIRRYSRSWGTQGIRTRVMADTRQAQAQIRNLEQILDRTAQGEHRVRVEAETARARGQLRGLQQIATGLGMQSPTVSVGVRGVAASTAQMLGLWKLADRLDGYNVRFTANVDQTISKVLPQALGALEQQVARFRSIATAAAAVSVPMLQTAVASLPGVLSMAATSAGALATRLGAGVAGAIGSVGSAAALGGAALGAYGYAMNRTLSYAFNLSSMLGDQKGRIDDAADAVKVAKAAVASATPGTQQYTNAVRGLAFAEQNAAFETRKMNAMMGYATPNMLKLNAAANDISIEFIKLGSAASDASAPMLTNWIRGLTGVMQNSRGAIVGMITDMNGVAASFVRTMSKGREFANLSTIFSGIRQAGVPAMQILTSAIRLFVNTFAATVPTGLKVLNMLSRVTMAAARWSGTAQGQSKIRTVWQSLAAAGAQLWRITRDVGIAMGGVIVALNATGIGQSMMNGLEGLAAAFRNVMRAGGQGRAAIVEMGTATRPALSAMADLVGFLGRQFGQMAMEVAKSGVVTDTIKAIHTALKGTETSMGIIPMLRHEFEVIGPLLPPLIKNLGLWFSTFGYAQPEMILFIKTITQVLEAFNSLPQPVQRTMARMLAWGSVIQMLGGSALVGLIAKIFLYRRAMATMRAVQAANGATMAAQAGIFSRMGTAIRAAAVATWTYVRATTASIARTTAAGVAAAASAIKVRVLSVATRAAAVGMRLMGVAATFMLGPWGLVIAGVIALGVALVVAYRRSETFRNAVNALGNFIKTTAIAAFRGLVNAARAVWQWFTRLPAPVQALISPLGFLIANFSRVRSVVGAVVRFLGTVATAGFNNLKAVILTSWRIISTVTRVVWNGLRAYFGALWNGIVAIARPVFNGLRAYFGALWRGIAAVSRVVWNALRAYFVGLWRGISAVARAIWGGLRAYFGALFRGIAAVARAVWGPLRAYFVALWRGTVAVARAVWGGLRAYFGALWRGIAAVSRAVWNGLRAYFTGLWRGIVAVARAVWGGLRAYFGALWRGIGAVARAVWSGLRAYFTGLWRGIVAAARGIWNGLRAYFSALWNGIRAAAQAAWNGIRAVVLGVARAVSAGVRAAWNAIRSATSAVFNAVRNVARSTWNAIRNVIASVARAALNGVRAAWNAIRSVTQSVFNAVRSVAQSVWNGVRSVVTSAARGALNGARSAWNALRSVTTSVFNGIRNFLRSLWAGIRSLFDSALTAIGNRVRSWTSAVRQAFSAFGSWAKGHWNSFWRFVRNLWDSALRAIGDRVDSWRQSINDKFSALASWARSHWNSFWRFIRNLWDDAMRAIGNRVDSWRQAINDKFSALASWARGHWQSFWKFLRGLWDDAMRAIGNRVDSWRKAINDKMSALASWARGHWQDFWSGLRNMWDNALSNIGDRARSWGNAIKSLFKKVAGWMTGPIEKASDTLKSIWNGILSGIGKVLGAVGLKDAASKINGAKWAKGGTTEGGGGQAFANGGTTTGFRAFAAGGMGTSNKQPRMHLWNEQMGNEAYITERGKSRDQMRYLNTAAGWHGARVVPQQSEEAPKEPPPKGAHSHANDAMSRSKLKGLHQGTRGAHPDFSRNHKNVYDYIKKRADDVAGNVGGVSWNTYHHHITAPGANEHSSVDFWAPGGPGAAIGKSKGDQTAKYVANNHAAGNLGTIWNRQVSTGGGFRSFGGAPHLDHVHVGWSTDPDAKIVKGGSVGGGGMIPNPMQILFDKTWNNTVGRVMDGFRSDMEGGHVLRQGTAGAATIVTQGIHKWIDDKIPDTIGGGGSDGGPGLNFEGKNNRDLGKKMNEAMGWGGQWGALDKLWTKESGWSHTAQNPTSSAYGIPQAMVSAHSMPKGYGPPGGDPKVQIDWGLGYIKDRYGDPNAAWGHSQRVGWYERGGVVPGFRPTPAVLHGGERVLPRDLNVGFESLSRSIGSWNSRGASAPSVDVGDNHRDLKKLIERVDHLAERVDHQTATVPRATGAAVKDGTDHNLARDRTTRGAAEDGRRKTSIRNSARGKN